MTEDFEIEGLAELNEFLDQMPARHAKQIINAAIEPAIQVVKDELKASAPVKIGILEESIVSTKRFENTGDSTILTAKIGPMRRVFWGVFQEYGTRFEPAQHWMSKAWEACKQKALSAFVTAAQEQLEKVKSNAS